MAIRSGVIARRQSLRMHLGDQGDRQGEKNQHDHCAEDICLSFAVVAGKLHSAPLFRKRSVKYWFTGTQKNVVWRTVSTPGAGNW